MPQSTHTLRYVLSVILFVATICHFLYWRFTYRRYRARALAHPRVQVQMRKLRALKRDAKARAEGKEIKPSGRKGKKNRRKSRRKKRDDSDSDSDSDVHVDVSEIVTVKGWAGRKPGFWDILPFQLVYMAVRRVNAVWWYCRWSVLSAQLYSSFLICFESMNLTLPVTCAQDLQVSNQERAVGPGRTRISDV